MTTTNDNELRDAFELDAKSYDQHDKKFNFSGVNNQWTGDWHYTFSDVACLFYFFKRGAKYGSTPSPNQRTDGVEENLIRRQFDAIGSVNIPTRGKWGCLISPHPIPPVKQLGEDEAVEIMAEAIMDYEVNLLNPEHSGRQLERDDDVGFMEYARAAYRALLAANAIKETA